MKTNRSIFILAMAFVAASSSHAVSVTGWSEVGANQPLSNAGTASPTLGNGSSNSADTGSIYASFSTISLTKVGDFITFTGSATFTTIFGAASLANQFRFGLFNANDSTTDLGWLGYFMGNGDTTTGGQLWKRNVPNTGTFPSTVNSLYS